jgi:ATP-dependent DNA helicase RecG
MYPVIVQLIKILKLEQSQNFNNKSVYGGLENYTAQFKKDASEQKVTEEIINSIISFLSAYKRLPYQKRITSVSKTITDLELINHEDSQVNRSPKIYEPSSKYENNEIASNVMFLDQKQNSKLSSKHTYIDLETGLSSPLLSIPSVGPSKAKTFQNIGVFTLEDLLYYFPRKYEDFRDIKKINTIKFGEKITILGTIKSANSRSTKNVRFKITELIIEDGSGTLRITFFNQPYLVKKFKQGELIYISGSVDTFNGRLVMNNPRWEKSGLDHLETNRIVPIYKLTKNLTEQFIRKVTAQTVKVWAPRLKDFLPQSIIDSAQLMGLPEAIEKMHLPDNFEELDKARERISFDEIFFLQIGALIQKRDWQSVPGKKFPVDRRFYDYLEATLPYELTKAQKKSIKDLEKDFSSGIPMSRLLQGDVGSGKTMVAAFGFAIVMQESGTQAAFMAPTGILAEQHYANLLKFFENSSLIEPDQICLLTGDTSAKDKELIRTKLKSGAIRILIGTHALIEDPIIFHNLQFIVIDEQHRFGVQQRAKLRDKGAGVHLLVMTATPIPRSLALTVFGDLDLSIIDEMPPGRIPVNTYIINPDKRNRLYQFIQSQVNEGGQVFIIYPLIESDDPEIHVESKAAVNEYQRLRNEVFQNNTLGLLHGKLRSQEKDEVMSDFRDKKYQILVSTTVIEVGVDIPNASVIVIEGANRFGLSQLHQLRGRVGRGKDKSYCFLIPENENSIENERLNVLSKTNDGFVLAEKDLELRGPGDFLGNRQSGFKDLQLMNIMNVKLIEKARFYAEELFNIDPTLSMDENKGIKKFLVHYWNFKIGELS